MEASRQEPQRRGTGKQKRSRSHGFLFGQHLSSEGFQAWHESSVEKPCGLARGVEVAAERTPWVGPQWQQGSKGQKKLTAQLAGHERNHNARRAETEGCVSGYTYVSRVTSPQNVCRGVQSGTGVPLVILSCCCFQQATVS